MRGPQRGLTRAYWVLLFEHLVAAAATGFASTQVQQKLKLSNVESVTLASVSSAW